MVQWAWMVNILGLGFTGARLARRLLRRPVRVSAAVRGVERFSNLADAGLQLSELNLLELDLNPDESAARLPQNALLAVLIPPLAEPENRSLRSFIRQLAPKRVVYVSSTGVYGDQIEVDQDTPAKPSDERGRLRLEEEHWISSGPWTSLILRAAAIYGPGRGVHAALRAGKLPRGAGSGIVSRVHVDDLAAIVEAGLFSDVTGAWPVADEAPCSSAEIAAWCAERLQLENASNYKNYPAVSLAGRKVDGRRIRELLGVDLAWPSWQTGVAASLAEELSLPDPQ